MSSSFVNIYMGRLFLRSRSHSKSFARHKDRKISSLQRSKLPSPTQLTLRSKSPSPLKVLPNLSGSIPYASRTTNSSASSPIKPPILATQSWVMKSPFPLKKSPTGYTLKTACSWAALLYATCVANSLRQSAQNTTPTSIFASNSTRLLG